MADDLKPPARDRGCCGDVDDVGREANERAEQQLPEWRTPEQWRSLGDLEDEDAAE